MTTQWVIEVRLGLRPDAEPLRRRVIEAASEAEALRAVLAEAEADLADAKADLDGDGQEEVFARAETAGGHSEHHRGEEGHGQ
ncbi:MAG: hypothetical protein Q7V15_13550 [Phenylobacterium sp.]|uniref:hypothetical protein n=1 Tax=Phenylobacterium sp. TaxID=1871053 RepID=UPI002720DF51|nr:hypothetical protein [Phenylobacterium sp.]MDO8902367.1 hypothetical protein [Phenylobacterium sp.]MDP2215534.1 hypothetical protein [Phenylobacterium sp.]